jgi:hypothetical protein
MIKKIVLIAIALVILCSSALAQYQSPGGSNYGWYNIDGCNREPYGVIYNYDVAQATIDSQLQAMYANGQRRLTIPIYHARGLNSGTIMDSTGGDLSPRFRNNLTNFLNNVRQTGFSEIIITFNPQSSNWPPQWTVFHEDIYQENLNLIINLRSIIANSGLPYRIDLLSEGTPDISEPIVLEYTQRLWNDYKSRFGKGDTVGFSIIGDVDRRVRQVQAVYQGDYPHLFKIHFYENVYSNFINARNILNGSGLTQGWIIGEAFYNDPQAAREFKQAIQETGQTVFFLTQWPLTRLRPCNGHVDIAPPLTNSAYYNSVVNPIDDAQFFVRQHYLDFLNREPDQGGFAFWTGQITQCDSDAGCVDQARLNISKSFFESTEFQGTGYFAYRFYKSSFGRLPRFSEFLSDARTLGQRVVVGAPGWEQQLESNKVAFTSAWMNRADFKSIYDTKTNEQYVDTMFANAGIVPSQTERSNLIDGLNNGTETRATVLRKMVDNQAFFNKEYNPSFVLFEYFGYLRRNPDDAPDNNMDGYNFWLSHINSTGSYTDAIRAFIVSGEYRGRFGQP